MQVTAALSNGQKKMATIEMAPNWSIEAHLEGEQPVLLELQAVLPSISTGLIYFFTSSKPLYGLDEASVVGPLPHAANELLLYAPLVALVKRAEGFQALSWSAWRELTSASTALDFGMASSVGDSCPMASMHEGLEDDGMDPSLDADILSSESEGKTAGSEESGEDEDLADADGSDDDDEVCSTPLAT